MTVIQRQCVLQLAHVARPGQMLQVFLVSGLSTLVSTDSSCAALARKCSASAGMSSRRSARRGMWMRMTFSRWNRSSRNLPARTVMRTDNRRVAADPVELAIGQHAQQAVLGVGRHVADLVEEQVPPSACSKRPRRWLAAPVKAPLVTEQLGFHQVLGIAAMFSAMNGDAERGLWRCSAWATSPCRYPIRH